MSHDPMFTEGGIAAFRCFRKDPDGGYLRSLAFSSHQWGQGELQADGLPTHTNRNGLWGFKTLPEAVHQEGSDEDLVFALTQHWGKMVEYETGLRSQYAAIMAFIEPWRPAQLEAFPREALARNYPDVPLIHQRDIAAKIEELRMVTLPKSAPAPLMQWLGPEDELVWAPETIGPLGADGEEYEMLPAAASYPGETHPVDQRLRKVSFEDAAGDRYEFWELLGTGKGSHEALALVRPAAKRMYRHRVSGPVDAEE
jgi:hypothetical protein